MHEEIRERERRTWGQVAEGWRRNDQRLRESAGPVTARMLDLASLSEGRRVLDIASGTGEPAIPAAERVGRAGRVIGIDLVEDMLAVARDKARRQGLANLEFHCLDAEALPFEPSSFDAATIRWGLMFMPDPLACLRQVHRLLIDGGRLVVSCWAEPERNPFFTHAMSILMNHMDVPQPPPGAPGVFAFADPARLVASLREAGFRDVRIEEMQIDMIVADSGEEYWQVLQDLAGPIVLLMQQMDEDSRAAFVREVIDSAEALRQGGVLRMAGVTWIAHGTKYY